MKSPLTRKLRYAAKSWALRQQPRLYYDARRTLKPLDELEMTLLPRWCRRDAIAIDVGANFGVWTHAMAQRCAHVHAIEPIPHLAQMLQRGWSNANVSVYPFAASDAEGAATLRVPKLEWGYSTVDDANHLDGKIAAQPIDALRVRTATVDHLRLTNVCVIKVDVEGHEAAVLRGLTHTIESSRPALIVESESRHNPTGPTDVIAFMKARNYTVSKLRPDGALIEVQAPDGSDVPGRNLVFEPR